MNGLEIKLKMADNKIYHLTIVLQLKDANAKNRKN